MITFGEYIFLGLVAAWIFGIIVFCWQDHKAFKRSQAHKQKFPRI